MRTKCWMEEVGGGCGRSGGRGHGRERIDQRIRGVTRPIVSL